MQNKLSTVRTQIKDERETQVGIVVIRGDFETSVKNDLFWHYFLRSVGSRPKGKLVGK